MILRLSVMPCLRGLTNPLITLVLEGSGGRAEHWDPIKCI